MSPKLRRRRKEMPSSRSTTIITTTIITIITGVGGTTTTITIITTGIAVTIDRRDDQTGQDPLGPVFSLRRHKRTTLWLARLFFRGAVKMPIGAVEHGVR
jgi:hypothetical protein